MTGGTTTYILNLADVKCQTSDFCRLGCEECERFSYENGIELHQKCSNPSPL